MSPERLPGQQWTIPYIWRESEAFIVESSPPSTNPTSKAVFAIASVATDGFTQVPPVPTEANGNIEDCNNDVGTKFNFPTFTGTAGTRGTVAVFNHGNAAVQLSIQNIAPPVPVAVPGYQNIVVASGTVFLNKADAGFQDLGNLQFALSSTGPVTIWAGDVQGGYEIEKMGDDVTMNIGNRGLSFLIHSQSDDATMFAHEQNTTITYTTGSNPETVVDLNADGFLALPAGALYRVTASRPISIQTVGSGGLDNWGVVLRPAQKLDEDGNGISDFDEGGNCASIAPDTDGDGLFDFQDPDDDNDCISDVADSDRKSPVVPNVDLNLNCSNATICNPANGRCELVSREDSGSPLDIGTADAGLQIITPKNGDVLRPLFPVRGLSTAGASIRLDIDGRERGSAIVESSGLFDVFTSRALSQGPHSLQVHEIDSAGDILKSSKLLIFL